MEFPNKGQTQGPKPAPAVKPPIVPVVTGAVAVKRSGFRRFADHLFSESPKALGAKIGRDVVVPRLKMGFEEALNSFLSGMLWGGVENRPMSNMVRQATLRGGMTAYSTISSQHNPAALAARTAVVTRSTGNYQDLILPSVESAEELLRFLFEHLSQYSIVTVGDFYEAASMPTQISDQSYGWTTLEGARIRPMNGGYCLELPRPTLI